MEKWSAQDSTYGSRHLAAKWSQDGTIGHIKAFLNADMIGRQGTGHRPGRQLERRAGGAAGTTAAKNTGHASCYFERITDADRR